MRTIPLGDILVDDEDYERLSQYNWYLNESGYAVAKVDGKTERMHRLILGLEPFDGKAGDHVNRNRLDNRRSNLRVVTTTENNRNSSVRKDSKSGVRGVCWDVSRGKWKAHIGVGTNKLLNIGRYETKEEAVAARQAKELELWGYTV